MQVGTGQTGPPVGTLLEARVCQRENLLSRAQSCAVISLRPTMHANRGPAHQPHLEQQHEDAEGDQPGQEAHKLSLHLQKQCSTSATVNILGHNVAGPKRSLFT